MFKACKLNIKVIKTTVSLKIEIKEKSPFCGLTFHSMQSLKTTYQQKEKLMLNLIKQTVTLYVGSITSYRAFCLSLQVPRGFLVND